MAATEFTTAEIASFTKNYAKVLGRGAFGKVYKGKIRTKVAVKESVGGRRQDEQLRNEEQMLQVLHRPNIHQNIVRLVGHCFTGEKLSIVLEYVQGGALSDNLQGLNWSQTLVVIKGIAVALRHFQSQNPVLVHNDLKPANILLDEKKEPKLCDFGAMKKEDEVENQIFTIEYVYSRHLSGSRTSSLIGLQSLSSRVTFISTISVSVDVSRWAV